MKWQKYPADNTGQLGEQVTYGYNAAGGLTSVAGQATYVSSTTYDAAGRPDVRTLGSGLATDYDYYPWTQSGGRLARLQTGALQDLRYGYDAVGNVTRIEDYQAGAPEVQSFSYDSLDRLTGVSGAYTETYAYAANGNLINKAGVDYSYSAPVSGCAAGTPGTKPHAVAQAGSRAYSYDCNGNMTDRAGQVLSYDKENRLTQVIGEAVTAYRYNGDGQRVTLTTGCTTTTYVGNYFEWRGSAATSTSYYYAGGTRIAMRTGTPITGTVSYLVGDHLGSSSVSYRVGDGQTVTQRYYPWGTIRPGPDNALPTDYGFTGQKLDASAGLLYYGARYYDSALGRFLQADTIVPQPGKPQALNRYTYAANNPLKYTDPTGHFAWFVPLITGVVGAGTGFIGSVAGQMLTADGSFQDRLNVVNWKSAGVAAGVGFVAGAAAPFTAVTALGAAVTSAVASGTQYVLTQGVNNERVDPGDLTLSVGLGAVAGRIAGPVTTSARALAYEATSRWLDRQVVRAIVDEGIAETAVKGPALVRSVIAGLTSNAPTAPIRRGVRAVWNRLTDDFLQDDSQPADTTGGSRYGGYRAE